MNWTTEPPTKSGWYWLQTDFIPKCVVKVIAYYGEPCLNYDAPMGYAYVRVSTVGPNATWAGPIEEPTDD